MESFKNNMVTEMSTLQVAITKQKRCVYFLFSYNDLPNICVEPVEESGRIVQGECLHAIKATLKLALILVNIHVKCRRASFGLKNINRTENIIIEK